MSTKRISIVNLRSSDTIAGAEVFDGGENFFLQAFAPLEFGFFFAKTE